MKTQKNKKAVITITETKEGVTVKCDFYPSAEESGAAGYTAIQVLKQITTEWCSPVEK